MPTVKNIDRYILKRTHAPTHTQAQKHNEYAYTNTRTHIHNRRINAFKCSRRNLGDTEMKKKESSWTVRCGTASHLCRIKSTRCTPRVFPETRSRRWGVFRWKDTLDAPIENPFQNAQTVSVLDRIRLNSASFSIDPCTDWLRTLTTSG